MLSTIKSARSGSISNIRQSYKNAYKQYISGELKEKLFRHSGYASGSVILQRIGSAPDTSPAVALQTPHQSYLFNCGEGTERALLACGYSFNTVSQVFFTQKHWGTFGGISSLLRYGSPPNFHGFDKLFTYIRQFSFLSTIGGSFPTTIQPNIVNETGFYEDADVRIDKIPVANRMENPNHACTAFSYLCKLKALRGAPLKYALDRTDAEAYEHTSSVDRNRHPDRPEINFLS